MTKHTQGPWEIDYDTRPASICTVHGLPPHGDEKQTFAYVRGEIGYWDADEQENAANLRLIAAAPELLFALEEARNGLIWYQETCPEHVSEADHEAMDRINAAIEKATKTS